MTSTGKLAQSLLSTSERFDTVHPCDHAARRAFERRLSSMVNALPRSISFPYGADAFGLTTYCALPKHSHKGA